MVENKNNSSIDYSILLKYIPYFENKVETIDIKLWDILEQLNFDSYDVLTKCYGMNRGADTYEYLIDVYIKNKEDSKNYFDMDVSNKDEKTVVVLINMTFAFDRWNGDLIETMVIDGRMLKWLLRLMEIFNDAAN